MPLVTDRGSVLAIYAEAARKGWVIPTFCSENLTTTEAVLAGTFERGQALGQDDLPVTVAITNLYSHRSQSVNYTHTRDWRVGLQLFLADLRVLTGPESPFRRLRVMAHLDHIQFDDDRELLAGDLSPFSSIMYDASRLPFEENIRATRRFVERQGARIVIEGACDEIVAAGGNKVSALTTPERAEQYLAQTGVDFIVANLGTEHRASVANLRYRSDLARRIRDRVGARIVLHGASSVPTEQVRSLFSDGVCKVNIWTMLERDSAPALFRDMVEHAAMAAGPNTAQALQAKSLLGAKADIASPASLQYCTTTYRQGLVFEEMTRIVRGCLELWYS